MNSGDRITVFLNGKLRHGVLVRVIACGLIARGSVVDVAKVRFDGQRNEFIVRLSEVSLEPKRRDLDAEIVEELRARYVRTSGGLTAKELGCRTGLASHVCGSVAMKLKRRGILRSEWINTRPTHTGRRWWATRYKVAEKSLRAAGS